MSKEFENNPTDQPHGGKRDARPVSGAAPNSSEDGTDRVDETMEYSTSQADESTATDDVDEVEEESPPSSTPAKSEEPESDEMPKRLGRYQVKDLLGKGAFGAVYDGYDTQLERRVAIKVPRIDGSNENVEQEFLEEARRLAKLSHSSIVTVFDVGVDANQCYIVSDYIAGGSLTDWLIAQKPTWQEAASIIAMLAEALAHAHAEGIVHRDIKTDNILLADSVEGIRPVLVDFGLALCESQDNMDLGYVSGTPTTMSPEQASGVGHRIDGRTDIYSLGVVMYQMLCGRLPFRASKRSELLRQVREDEPQPPRQLVRTIPRELEKICLTAMAKSLNDRYTTAADIAEDIREVLASNGQGEQRIQREVAVTTSVPNDAEVGATVDHLADGICRVCGTQNAPGASSCQVCGSTMGTLSDKVPAETQSDPSLGETRELLTQSTRQREAEKRQITVLSCSFELDGASDEELGSPLEDEHERIVQFRNTVQHIISEIGGTTIQSTGQEVVACYGFPIAIEDAPRRAVATGLRLLEAASGLNRAHSDSSASALQTWIGIHSGIAVVEQKTESSSTEPISIVGDVRTIASRIEEAGDENEVIVSGDTRDLIKGFFECESVGKLSIKRVSRKIEAFKVSSQIKTANRIDLVDPKDLTPLIGRDTEIGMLKDRWEQAEDGLGQVVLLIGEAGLGKSRLIREIKEHLAQQNPASPIVEWRCSSYHQSSGLFPAIEFFERLLDLHRDESPESRLEKLETHLHDLNIFEEEALALFAAMLSIPPTERLSEVKFAPQRQREKTQKLLLDWLREYSSQEPVLFIVEDLHWVDPTTLELLGDHVREGISDSMLTLMTFRPDFETPWKSMAHQTQVALNRLTKRQIRKMMVAGASRQALPESVVNQVIERTDGVPLFVEEFSKAIEEAGDLADTSVSASTSRRDMVAIPRTLQDLLMSKLQRISDTSDTVQLAATLGREFTYELISAISDLGEEQLGAELEKLVEAELLFQKGRPPSCSYIFKHALIQDAAYDSLLKKTKQRFHQRIADVVENTFPEIAETQPDLLARHFTEAGDVQKAIEYWLTAGKRSQTLSANSEAISQLAAGLELVQELDESPERDQLELGLQLTLAPVLMAAKGWSAPEVGTALEQAKQLVTKIGSIEDQFFVMWGLWGWRIIRADMDVCQGIADDIMRMVKESPEGDALLAEAYWCVGCTAYYKGDPATALELLEKGLECEDEERAKSYALMTGQNCSSISRSHIALALFELGYPDQALQRMDEMLEFTEALNHPFSYAMALFFRRRLLEYTGAHEEALKVIEQEYEVCHENGFVFFEVHAIFGRGVKLLKRGKLDEAREQFDLGLTMQQATGGCNSMDHAFRNIAEAYIEAGMPDDAAKWLQRGFDMVQQNNAGMESELLRLRGEIALAASDQENAEKDFLKALEVAQQRRTRAWELRAASSLAQLRKSQGRNSEGVQVLQEAYSHFGEGFETADLVAAQALLKDLGADG